MNAILANLGLSAEDKAIRKNFIGGSDANIIMSGDADKLIRLWREKRGEAEPEDLSDILAVQMGSYTEPFNVAWWEKQSGERVVMRGDTATHAGIPNMRVTLDGITVDDFGFRRVFEAKHVGVRQTDAEIFERYVPQLTHACLVTGLGEAVLSAFKGNGDWAFFEYVLDADYADALIEAEARFWSCVQSGEPPAPLPPPPVPKPKGVKEYSFETHNEWASLAAEFLETILPAQRHEGAKKGLKELVPDDASKAFGHGIIINRDKRGALRFALQGDQQ